MRYTSQPTKHFRSNDEHFCPHDVDPSTSTTTAHLTGEFEKREETTTAFPEFKDGCDKMNADEANGIVELAELAAIFFENKKRMLGSRNDGAQLVFENFLLFAAMSNISVAMDKDRPPSNMECDAMLQVGSEIIDAGMPKHLVPRYLSSEYVGKFTAQVNYTSEANRGPIFANHGMIPIVVNH